MVLAQLGGRISRVIQQMANAKIIDEKVLSDCLDDIKRALLQADVQFMLVRDLPANIQRSVTLDSIAAAGNDNRNIIKQAISDQLRKILDPGKPSFTPEKGKTSVVMFVGLHGSGKTTTCTKYAHFHQKKGWKPAVVCADTFRAGAFDQLKQNAAKAKIPFYGSYTESDPVRIAVEGVELFKKENCDLIIVDTSGRHKQEAALFEEMRQLCEATKPELVVFVMDSSIGRAAYNQAKAFKQSVPVGAIILTRMDGNAKGGGALSAVAATKSPVIFMGTGEHMDDFEVFDVEPLVKRLLGMGDNSSGLVAKNQEVVSIYQQHEHLLKRSQRNFTLRNFYEYFKTLLKTCPTGPVLSMLPEELMPKGSEKETRAKVKRYITVMESMTKEELDTKMTNESRIMEIARESGRSDLMEILEEYKVYTKFVSRNMEILDIPRKEQTSGLSGNVIGQQTSNALRLQIIKQMGGLQMGSNKDIMAVLGAAEEHLTRLRS
ncbi:hypothetical protein ACP275_08G196000 [Erythranthe tilingii]